MSDDEFLGKYSNSINKQYNILNEHMECYNTETSAVNRKLKSKIDALRILRTELERFRMERDQYKLMAETLQLRYSALKYHSDLSACTDLDENQTSVGVLLHETRERNLKLSTEVETLKQKLSDIQGDIEIIRSKQHLGQKHQNNENNIKSINNIDMKEWKMQQANFICHLEQLKKENAQLAYDLKALIDEKEEIITERDAYKCKAHRLNHELYAALKGNRTHPKYIDIDGIILENKYLHERLKNNENELELSKQSIDKYKAMLTSKRKKDIIKLSASLKDEHFLNLKQVQMLQECGINLPINTESSHDLKSLCLALLENLIDKNLELSHQKKTNKILGTRIAELELRLQTLCGFDDLTNDSGYAPSQFLLYGYCPSMGDIDNTKESSKTNNEKTGSITTEHDIGTKLQSTAIFSDDGMSSLSTESERSMLSSEYGIDVCLTDFINNAMDAYKPSSTLTDSGNCGLGTATTEAVPGISSSISRERFQDLKDLPSHLSALVQKTLYELDMRDFDSFIKPRSSTPPFP